MSEFIAEAQVLIVPNTATFAATLRAQLEAAVLKAGPVVVPVTAAPLTAGAAKTVAKETQAATVATKAQTSALAAEAGAAKTAAVAQKELAVAEARSTRIHAQATRGLAAETLALTGLRGATLAASGPFLIGATGAIIFAKSVKAASDETESINKTFEVFGDSAALIVDFSETTARSLGISRQEALESAATFGNLFRAIKIGEPVAASMSKRLVELAADLASFNNADPTRVLEALRSGLVGQARPLRVFGIFISAARVSQEALIETGKKSVKQLSEAEKAQARFNIILEDSVIAQGDVSRTADTLANQSRFLKAQLSDLAASIGQTLIPGLTNVVSAGSNVLRIFKDLADLGDRASAGIGSAGDRAGASSGRLADFRKAAADFLTPGRAFADVTKQIADDLDRLAGNTDKAAAALPHLSDALDAGARAARLAAFAIVQAQQAIFDVGQEIKGLEITRLKIQTGLAPGGRGAEQANLRQQIEEDKKLVAQSKSGTAARRDALQQLKADQDDLARLQEQDASDAEDRANRIKDAATRQEQAAREAAQAQAEATAAFIEAFSGRRDRIQNRLTSAQLFGTAKQQIALNKLIVAADKAEIEAIIDRIRHLKLHGEALKIAKAAIAALNQEIFNTRNAIRQLQAERKQAIADARQSHLEAQLAIAETTAATKDDVSAQKALIKFDQAQIRRILAIKRRRRLTQEEAAQLDAYRVDLAQRNAALKKSREEQDTTNKRMKELMFSFLQTQQGFAANLLGNLIPGFATGGLVGNTSPAGQGPAALGAGPQDRVEQTAALGASKGRGVSPVQVDTTNQLLRQILATLQGRHTQPPEIRNNRAEGHAMFDIF